MLPPNQGMASTLSLGSCGACVLLAVAVGCGGTVGGGGAGPAPAPEGEASWLPPSDCVPVGTATKLVTPITDSVSRIVPNGSEVWFSAWARTPSAPVASGALFHVPLAGGAAVREPVQPGATTVFDVAGGTLAYVVEDESARSSGERLVVRDRATNAEVASTRADHRKVGQVRARDGRILFLSSDTEERSAGGIVRFDAGRDVPVVAADLPYAFASDASDVYYTTSPLGGAQTLEATALDGTRRRPLVVFEQSIRNFYAVVGVGADEVYFSRVTPIGHGAYETGEVRAVRKDGSGERVVATIPDFDGTAVVDPTYVTWVSTPDGEAILGRTRLADGVIERIALPDRGTPSALAVDRCNLYFATSDGVYARSRLP